MKACTYRISLGNIWWIVCLDFILLLTSFNHQLTIDKLLIQLRENLLSSKAEFRTKSRM